MNEPMWASGPGEILRHGLSLLEKDTDTNRRLAMISIDNSVELMLQTFIQLPKRVTGVDLPRAKRDEICKSFLALLDGIEANAPERVKAFDLGLIEWFHRLRNQLYHQGNGLTVERSKVEAYAELALGLFKALYDADLDTPETEGMKSLSEFATQWSKIEEALEKMAVQEMPGVISKRVQYLVLAGFLTGEQARELKGLQSLRNSLVHGNESAKVSVGPNIIKRTKHFAKILSAINYGDLDG